MIEETPAAYGAAQPPADMATLRAAFATYTREIAEGWDAPKAEAKILAAFDELAASRERIAALEAWQERVKAVLQDLAIEDDLVLMDCEEGDCVLCHKAKKPLDGPMPHEPFCPVIQSRALLADVAHHDEGETK